MKRLFVLGIGCAVMALGTVAQAGSPCCMGKQAKAETLSAKACSKSGCDDLFKQLNLTEEQQTQLTELKATCDKEGCSKTGYEKYMTGVKNILTAEQLAKCAEICKENGWQCPMADDSVKAKDAGTTEG